MTPSIPAFAFMPGPLELIIIGLILLLLVVPVIAVIAALTAGKSSSPTTDGGERVQCPHCAEWIMPQAVKCRFCGENLTPGAQNQETGGS